ncbi:GNAT family N-acetyltransferase [Aurantimonas endophytica]|uniref:GNAT superfamily N-acetyltransferase n=1 Tax=Aurantimonas endophytica TaxID=1522175 RepID=A0A7W6HGS4_9HYPH|nr:GNAT family N-acetyltransferase [Aurantimonas endophytica]MBB4004633.1 GNAT superfamily N-acetyltransferase [Aurantimonas endophytica]MCO6405464.1 GNAT family N-acetyltransferase [Aurantimonas endophytica]
MVKLTFRRATLADIPAIVSMLADDDLGSQRETATEETPQHYFDAFSEVDADPNQFLCVVQDSMEIVGTLQLTFIPGLARNGSKRGQIEAVRIVGDRRGERIGESLFAWALEECRSRGCSLVQLTTDKARPNAHRFYDRLGFKPTHIGYKLFL